MQAPYRQVGAFFLPSLICLLRYHLPIMSSVDASTDLTSTLGDGKLAGSGIVAAVAGYTKSGLECAQSEAAEEVMDAYCMKCRAKREITNPSQVTLKNGRPATQGTCSACGTKVFRMGRA